MKSQEQILDSVLEMHRRIRSVVRDNVRQSQQDLNMVVAQGNGDVTYKIDLDSEGIIDSWFSDNPPDGGAIVLCEGMGKRVYPHKCLEEDAKWYILIDPLDGTRHIMYDNRSCWILTGIAENHGKQPLLSDIQIAVQTEVPTTLQDKGITMTAIRGKGVRAIITDLVTQSTIGTVPITPSRASTLENGFAVFSNFFPGTKEVITRIEESLLSSLYGEPKENGALIFSEQYISNAGQLFMITSGKYRMIADVRALLSKYQKEHKKMLPLCTHPYDLSASLIAEEAGCILVGADGDKLHYPMDLETNCAWFCYANEYLKSSIHPVLVREMQKLGIID